VLATTDPRVLLYGAGSLTLGVVAFLFWARHNRRWPFAPAAPAKPSVG